MLGIGCEVGCITCGVVWVCCGGCIGVRGDWVVELAYVGRSYMKLAWDTVGV